MKKWLIFSIIGIVILIIIGIYSLNIFWESNEDNISKELTEEEIINLTEIEVEKYCQELREIALESPEERKGVCSGRREYDIAKTNSNIEVSIFQRVVYGVSTNRGSIELEIIFDKEGKIISELH